MDVTSRKLDRLPPYLFGRLNDLKQKLRQEGRDVIDMGMGNPDVPTPQHIVDKLCEVARDPKTHRYSSVVGIREARKAICEHYERNYGVALDPNTEATTVIGTKEGLSHMVLALIEHGDLVIVTNPAFPIHIYSVAIAGGNIVNVPLASENDFVPSIEHIAHDIWPRPKMMILNFPNNPTTAVVDLDFFEAAVDYARANDIMIIHDMAYSDVTFDGYRAPSILQVNGAKDVAVEFYSLSKSYSMAGWRMGYCVGNPDMVGALAKIKGYYDYGIFTPVQVAGIVALRGDQQPVRDIAETYRARRDVLVSGLNRIGWTIKPPKATMFVWAPIPERYRKMGAFEFSMKLLQEAEVVVSPGSAFGDLGEGYVRISLVENENRIRQAVRNIRRALG